MKIEKHESLKVADKVVTEMRALIKGFQQDYTSDTEIRMSCWSNGREQGYMLEIYPRRATDNGEYRDSRAVLIAQSRNSDHIIVVRDENHSFNFTTHTPSEADWKQETAFNWDQPKLAASYAINWLLNGKVG